MAEPTRTASATRCAACGATVGPSDHFCVQCGRIQPTGASDYFTVFGLPRELGIDVAALERQFYKLSRKLHPDRYSRASAAERELSLQKSSLLNDAYRTLADPVGRIEHLLDIEGVRRREQRKPAGSPDKQVPADLLEEVFELNMLLDEAREAGVQDSATRAQLETARDDFDAKLREVDEQLEALGGEWDSSLAQRTGGDRDVLRRIDALLDRRNYIRNLVRDVRSVLAA